jgi:GT2 family glycosyltransferase
MRTPPADLSCCVSAVILTCNRRAEVERTVARMRELPERPPLIVVDNGSADGTPQSLRRRFPDIELIEAGANLGAAGRNLGVRRARTPYVAFCDDDTWWAPGSLARAVQLLDRHAQLASVTARVLVGPEAREDPACAEMARSPLPAHGLPGHALLGFLAGATVFRRTAFAAANGYEPRFFLGGEEALLALDLAARGWMQLYVPELLVHHHPSAQRDAGGRRRLLLRNALWLAWLRRPLRSALRESARVLREARRQNIVLPVLAEAARGMRWVRRERRVIPAEIEALLRRLESQAR